MHPSHRANLRGRIPTANIIKHIRDRVINTLQRILHIRTKKVAPRRLGQRLVEELVGLATHAVAINALIIARLSTHPPHGKVDNN